MTRKVYKSAMGKTIDLGSLILQNEQVRAVGNMNVNARGDILDSGNKVIDQKNRQIQRQYQKTTTKTNVSGTTPVMTSTRAAKSAAATAVVVDQELTELDDFELLQSLETQPVEVITPIEQPSPVTIEDLPPSVGGGLAAAIARSKIIKQEKEKTLKEKQQAQGLRKI